ncbi:hypothetical protein Tco_0514248, partial [Tanacetum coccineum]
MLGIMSSSTHLNSPNMLTWEQVHRARQPLAAHYSGISSSEEIQIGRAIANLLRIISITFTPMRYPQIRAGREIVVGDSSRVDNYLDRAKFVPSHK